MLIALMLVSEGVLERPWLSVSLYFKQHRDEYHRLLQEVRTQGNWEAWLIFFLEGSIYQSVAMQSNLTVYDYLKKRIAIHIPETAEACGTTKPTVKRAIDDLLKLGIVSEVTGKPRNKIYIYQEYLDILNQD